MATLAITEPEQHCNRCNRKIKNEKSVVHGYGRICWKKHQEEVLKAEFEKNQTVLPIEQ